MIHDEPGRKQRNARKRSRAAVLGTAGIALLAAGVSAAGTWALRNAATAPDQSIQFESGSEALIKSVPPGLAEVNQWFSERGLVYGFSFDNALQIDGLLLSIVPAEGVVLPDGEVMLGGLVFNDAGQVVEFTAPTGGACVVIMTEDSTRPDGRRVRCVGSCDDGSNCLFRLVSTNGQTTLACNCD